MLWNDKILIFFQKTIGLIGYQASIMTNAKLGIRKSGLFKIWVLKKIRIKLGCKSLFGGLGKSAFLIFSN
jgi:hypothetical protein